jgi:hypothetical protein
MRFALVLLLLLSGCTMTHTDGELPEIEFPQMEQFCTKKFRVRTKSDEVRLECAIKLKGTFIL